MFRPRRPRRGGWRVRTGVFAFGAFIVLQGSILLKRGVFVYRNGYLAEMYSPALEAMGCVLMILALIPDSLVERLISKDKKQNDMDRLRNRATLQ